MSKRILSVHDDDEIRYESTGSKRVQKKQKYSIQPPSFVQDESISWLSRHPYENVHIQGKQDDTCIECGSIFVQVNELEEQLSKYRALSGEYEEAARQTCFYAEQSMINQHRILQLQSTEQQLLNLLGNSEQSSDSMETISEDVSSTAPSMDSQSSTASLRLRRSLTNAR